MTKDKLKEILERHEQWVESCGINGECADLRYADLRYADLRKTDLIRAVLIGANLKYADLSRTDLTDANLSDAVLRNADLRNADLSRADLRYADLRYADLSRADLSSANLTGANLTGANLIRANLIGANQTDVKVNSRTEGYSLNCPEEGSFIAFKKCENDTIVKLLIPEDAKRSSATSRKCRASKAIVLDITDRNGEQVETTASNYDADFIYKVGETVEVKDFNEDRWNDCSTGIHFFITRGEAEDY